MDSITSFFENVATYPIQFTQTYQIGGQVVSIHLLGDLDVDFFTRSLRHLRIESPPVEAIRHLYVLTNDTTSLYPPRNLYFNASMSSYSYDVEHLPARYLANVNYWSKSFMCMDYETSIAVFWSQQPLCPYLYVAPFLQLFQRWFIPTPLSFIHSGGVGNKTGGVILGGVSGAGKSTTTLACLESDLSYLGDDFLIVNSETMEVHSLYQNAKIEIKNTFRFPHLQTHISNPNAVAPEKHLLWIHDLKPKQIIQQFPLKAIFLPKFLGKKDTQLYPASKVDAMKALVPVSTLMLKADASQVRKIAQIVRQVPCYWLETGTDLTQIPYTIRQFLATC